MVEMLGVLAIIGVLSVGAIAGYQKAMLKYKLNKQAEQISQIISVGLRYAGQWNFNENTNYSSQLIKLGEIPTEMIKWTSSIVDIFGNSIQYLYTKTSSDTYTQLLVFLDVSKNNDYTLSICRNIVNVAKELHEDIRYIQILNLGSIDTPTNNYNYKDLPGDKYCKTTTNTCLKNISTAQIDEFCRFSLNKNNTPHMKICWDE